MNIVRTFLAFSLPDDVLDPVLTFQELLQERCAEEGIKARWVKPEQCHLTLRFFGEISVAQCDAVVAAVDGVLSQVRAIPTTIERLGTFPNNKTPWKRPRVLWLGMGDPEGALQALFRGLDDAFAGAGLGRYDKASFHPHITLARFKYAPGLAIKRAFEGQKERSFGACLLQELILYHSELTPQGAIYTPITRWALAE